MKLYRTASSIFSSTLSGKLLCHNPFFPVSALFCPTLPFSTLPPSLPCPVLLSKSFPLLCYFLALPFSALPHALYSPLTSPSLTAHLSLPFLSLCSAYPALPGLSCSALSYPWSVGTPHCPAGWSEGGFWCYLSDPTCPCSVGTLHCPAGWSEGGFWCYLSDLT